MAPDAEWIRTECAVCGPADASPVLTIPADDGCPETRVVHCSRCGLRRLTPRPGPAVLAAFYGSSYNAFAGRVRSESKQRIWNRLRDAYARPAGHEPGVLEHWVLGSFAEWAFDINVPLQHAAGVRVIDVGCGFGDLLIYLKSRGCETFGVDLDPRAAEQAARHGVEIRIGDLVDLKLPAASFDVAVMCHSLEHVPDPAAHLRELARIVRPGGRLHIAVPNGASAGLRIEGRGWAHLSHPLHVWFFDPRSLRTLVERAGFRLSRAPYTTSRWHHVSRWATHVMSSPIEATARFARLAAASPHRSSGDVLRLVAERLPR